MCALGHTWSIAAEVPFATISATRGRLSATCGGTAGGAQGTKLWGLVRRCFAAVPAPGASRRADSPASRPNRIDAGLLAVKLSPPVRALLIALAVIAVLWIVIGLAASSTLAPGSH